MFLPEGSLEDPKPNEAPLALKCPTSIRALPGASIALWGGLLNILVARSATPPYQKESRDSIRDSRTAATRFGEVSIRLDEVLATDCHSMAQSQDCWKPAALFTSMDEILSMSEWEPLGQGIPGMVRASFGSHVWQGIPFEPKMARLKRQVAAGIAPWMQGHGWNLETKHVSARGSCGKTNLKLRLAG